MAETQFIELLASYKIQKPRGSRVSSKPDIKPQDPFLKASELHGRAKT